MNGRSTLEALADADRKFRNARTLREKAETKLRAARTAEAAAHKAREQARQAVAAQFPEVIAG